MSTYIVHRGPGFDTLRAALTLLPTRAQPVAATARKGGAGQAGWIERLATWAERQPMHHRLGSYTQLR
jgi:hypothetical protein